MKINLTYNMRKYQCLLLKPNQNRKDKKRIRKRKKKNTLLSRMIYSPGRPSRTK